MTSVKVARYKHMALSATSTYQFHNTGSCKQSPDDTREHKASACATAQQKKGSLTFKGQSWVFLTIPPDAMCHVAVK